MLDTDLAATAAGNIAFGAIAGITIAQQHNECNNENRRLTIATASLTPGSTCSSSSLYNTKRSMKFYRILFNTGKKKKYIMHEKV